MVNNHCLFQIILKIFWCIIKNVGEENQTHLFFLECSSFPLFTPKILVMRVLKRRVEEFLTWVHSHTEEKEEKKVWLKEQGGQREQRRKPRLWRTYCPDRRGEAQYSSLQAVCYEGNDVLSQACVPVQSPQDVESMNLMTHSKFHSDWKLLAKTNTFISVVLKQKMSKV